MNKQRRKEIWAIIRRLQNHEDVQDIIDDIDMVYNEEYTYMENIPENMQMGDKYYKAEEACNHLECAMDCLRSDDYDIDVVCDYLSDAMM